MALMPVFKWAVERGAIDINPMTDLTRPKPAPRRKRVLDHAEIRAMWTAADALDWPFGPFYKLLLLTGARREEVAGMRWPELDLQRRIWRLPPAEEFQPRTDEEWPGACHRSEPASGGDHRGLAPDP